MWILLVFSSILGYYAHHLANDLPIPDSESDGQRTPAAGITYNGSGLSGIGDGAAILLQDFQSPNLDTEYEEIPLSVDEPASFTTVKFSHGGRIHARTITRVADWLRWIGKFLALVNAIGIIVNSVFQYAGVYDNCFCDSSFYTWGFQAFNVISPIQDDIDLAQSAWIGALALGLSCCTFFVGTMYLIRDSLPS